VPTCLLTYESGAGKKPRHRHKEIQKSHKSTAAADESDIILRLSRGCAMAPGPGEITLLLHRWREGDPQAEPALFDVLMPDLRKIAGCCFRAERPGHTLQPPALVSEAFVRLARAKNNDWRDRGHFFALAARTMRHFLIDHARARACNFFPWTDSPSVCSAGTRRWTWQSPSNNTAQRTRQGIAAARSRRIEVCLHGMTDEEAADALKLTLHTLQRESYRARRWLF